MDKQINQLPVIDNLTGNELFPIWGSDKSNQSSINKVKDYVKSNIFNGTATNVLLANGQTINYYKASSITNATSDDGIVTPLGMKNWTESKFIKKEDESLATEQDIKNIFK